MTLRVRWLGRVRFPEAHVLQRAVLAQAREDYLLLLEHPHIYTMGLRAKAEHVLVPPAEVGAELVRTDRGGDVTYHGPGQLVGYPLLAVPRVPGATPRYVHGVEQVIIDALADLGLPGASRKEGFPGVWVGERKICAIGVRLTRGRSMHGFALNVDPDLSMFDHIVPCGIPDRGVTSLAAEGLTAAMSEVVDAVAARATEQWGRGQAERQDVSERKVTGQPVNMLGRLAQAGVDTSTSVHFDARKPSWLRARAEMGPRFLDLKKKMRSLELVTVCEEAGCPNIFDCWGDGTATFMINGERCTRACGFCLVDTKHPEPLDGAEPEHVAEAVAGMGLDHAVITAVARDDLEDGGASGFVEAIEAVRRRSPGTSVEVLIPDCRGDAGALKGIFDARPDVLNHNLETVARLQRAVRPQASYARSLAVLGAAKAAGLVTKSGLILGMGESEPEVLGAMADLRAVGVEIVTLGQYLRPTASHLPVDRWWHPDEFARLRAAGVAMGFSHVEASPLTRSSYHAKQAAAASSAR